MLLCQRFWCADKLNIISDYYIVYMLGVNENQQNLPFYPHSHTYTLTLNFSIQVFVGSFQQRMAAENKNKIKNYWSHWAQGETTQEKERKKTIFPYL